MIVKVELLLDVNENEYITTIEGNGKTRFICDHVLGIVMDVIKYNDFPKLLEAKVKEHNG